MLCELVCYSPQVCVCQLRQHLLTEPHKASVISVLSAPRQAVDQAHAAKMAHTLFRQVRSAQVAVAVPATAPDVIVAQPLRKQGCTARCALFAVCPTRACRGSHGTQSKQTLPLAALSRRVSCVKRRASHLPILPATPWAVVARIKPPRRRVAPCHSVHVRHLPGTSESSFQPKVPTLGRRRYQASMVIPL